MVKFQHRMRALALLSTLSVLNSLLPVSAAYAKADVDPRRYGRDTFLMDAADSLEASNFPNESLVIQAFDVTPPILGPRGQVIGAGRPDPFADVAAEVEKTTAPLCEVTLAVRDFGNSFGQPFVGNYTPPPCLGTSNNAVLTLTVDTIGRQFDRLSFIFLGDIEILRWSTAQPRLNGVNFTTVKDVSLYMPLWREPQKVIFDLGNLLNVNLTGIFNTTLQVSFFDAPRPNNPNADHILPLSKRVGINGSQPSTFNTETDKPTTIIQDFPRNATKAVVTILSTGQIGEEFWWQHFPRSSETTFQASGHSAGSFSGYREVQLLIDGHLAGIQPPFPIVFTGGVNPALWSPLVGIDVFDEKEAAIDISPFLGLLADGQPHQFTFAVLGLDDDGKTTATLSTRVDNYWQLSGKIFVWTKDEADDSAKLHSPPSIQALDPIITFSQDLTKNATGANETLTYSISVSRSLQVDGSLPVPTGEQQAVQWSQSFTTTVHGIVTDFGSTGQLNFHTYGNASASRAGGPVVWNSFSYPLAFNSSKQVLLNGTRRTDTSLTRTKSSIQALASSSSYGDEEKIVFPYGVELFRLLPGSRSFVAGANEVALETTQQGSGTRLVYPGGGSQNGSYSVANTKQNLVFSVASGEYGSGDRTQLELYYRDVSVSSNGAIVSDLERLVGQNVLPGRAGLRRP